ncbi:MAG: hypothetical protein IAE96_04930 [Chitinophagaceae bacterium]|nr:hypothetical protein [Chitinophagaceae bacterium]
MNYKEEIKKTLKALKQMGFQRAEIESRLGLAEGSISQTIARNGSERLLKALVLYKEWAILSKSVNQEAGTIVQEPVRAYEDPMNRLLVQQNKLIDSMNQQSTTANTILARLADNVETKVESIDLSLADALARIESLTINVTSGRSVILKSLARIENKPELELQKEADNINAFLLQELSGKQSKKTGKGR